MTEPGFLQVRALYLSTAHNFFGHHGQPPGTSPVVAVESIECVAGAGIRGDRFFNYKPDYKGQITFFDWAVHQRLREEFPEAEFDPSVYRRNVLTEGMDLNELIGREFSLGGLRFRGSEECRPCYWMDQACAPGTEATMRGHGGLRARILSSGTLRLGARTSAGAG